MTTELFTSPTVTAHEHIGFELGWDYAHYRLVPPAPYAQEPSPLRNGLLAGVAAFGLRTLPPTRSVRKWLQLRLHAWLRGRSVELVQVTPHYLQQLDVSHCPITRVELSSATLENTDASIDRVRNDAGYAAGNLAVMSTKANHAKAAYGFRDALQFVKQIEAGALGGIAGLSAAQWSRVAVLCSFVEPLPHDEACRLPLLVLPPNRLRLFNPVQALQAFVSQQLLAPGWSHRVSRLEALLPGKPARRAFQTFFHALLPRVLEAGRSNDAQRARWAVEDAWRSPLVRQRWIAFAQGLTPEQCETVVAKATARKLGSLRVERVSDAQATEGWCLESRGYVPHAVLMRRMPVSTTQRPHDAMQASLPL
ncbi:MAG: hypothetical protein E6H58_12420 [Betaproteobacteria bacterium]|nr:MAG: hypothetical protein E6H65_07710 [Betaproteobacteria bacterium]TMH31381.1 MAG: hypothetical protein E6H58_12420 [Betaproteobacteria bacterium]